VDEQERTLSGADGTEEPRDEDIPVGILRLRQAWRDQGLPVVPPPDLRPEEPVVFPETPEGSTPVGDYSLPEQEVRARLRLSEQAMDRIVGSGEIDSILVRDGDGVRRLISVSSFERFVVDSAIDPDAKAPDLGVKPEDLEAVRQELEQMRTAQSKQLQQMKDILLLELRNLKEQDRDLASFVFEFARMIEETIPRKKRRR
jgi:hypothetical protein